MDRVGILGLNELRYFMKRKLAYVAIVVAVAIVGHFVAYKLVHIPRRLEMVVAVGLLLLYPIIRNPLVGVYASFLVLPFIPYARRLYYLAYARPALDPLIAVGDVLVAVILIGLFFEFRERRDQNSDIAGYMTMVMLYFGYLVLRTFAFNYVPVGRAVTFFKYYGPRVLFFPIGAFYATRFRDLRRLWWLTLIIGVVASLYGLKQLYLGYSEAERIWFSSVTFSTLFIKGIARPFSFFQAPVAFADYAQLAMISALLIAGWRQRRINIFLFLLVPMFFYSALTTSVRSSWIGIVVTLFMWWVLFRIKGNTGRGLVLGGVVVASVVFQLAMEEKADPVALLTAVTQALPGQYYVDRLITSRATALYNPLQEHSILSRLILWKQILALSKDPILAVLGRGLGALKCDSIYVTYLAEFGYPGVIFIIFVFVKFTLVGFRVVDTSRDPGIVNLAKGVTAMTAAFAVVSITGTHIHYFPGDIYFWFWNGVLIKLAALNEAELAIQEASAS